MASTISVAGGTALASVASKVLDNTVKKTAADSSGTVTSITVDKKDNTLPIASVKQHGLVQVGKNLVIDKLGNLSVVLPNSTTPSYANDAAAATGGVPVDGYYRNGNVIQVRLV